MQVSAGTTRQSLTTWLPFRQGLRENIDTLYKNSIHTKIENFCAHLALNREWRVFGDQVTRLAPLLLTSPLQAERKLRDNS